MPALPTFQVKGDTSSEGTHHYQTLYQYESPRGCSERHTQIYQHRLARLIWVVSWQYFGKHENAHNS